jgi:hypothetical protein
MQIPLNQLTFNRIQISPNRRRKNEAENVSLKNNGKYIARATLSFLLFFYLLITLYGCGKPSNTPNPIPDNTTGCAIASDVDQALGTRQFEYDDKGYLIKMTGPNYYYGPFIETIASAKVVDAYPSASVDGNGNHYYGNINIAYSYTGGSGNIYDGNPEFMHELFTATNPPSSYKRDSLFQFKYNDAKKHLTTVLITGSGSQDDKGFVLFRYELNFTYDASDNVTQVKIIYDWSKKTVVYPSGESRIDYVQTSDELLNITYDDKPSPYAAISIYWKFVGGDFNGFSAYNLDKIRFWAGRCAILSKNNPVKITGKLRNINDTTPKDINATITYQYNEKDLPVNMSINSMGVNAFTYNCK